MGRPRSHPGIKNELYATGEFLPSVRRAGCRKIFGRLLNFSNRQQRDLPSVKSDRVSSKISLKYSGGSTDAITSATSPRRITRGWRGRQKTTPMNAADRNVSRLVLVLRQQLALSQEDLARQLGVSFATVNRWENGHNIPSRLAQAQLTAFCEKMIAGGKLVWPESQRP